MIHLRQFSHVVLIRSKNMAELLPCKNISGEESSPDRQAEEEVK
jgi:hypothetical protein